MRCSALRSLGSLAVILAAMLAAPAVAQRVPDLRLNTITAGPLGSVRPRIAASESSVFVCWEDSRNGAGDVYLNYSQDGGATWQASDIRLDTDQAGTAHSFGPQIAVSGAAVYVVWADTRNGAPDIYFTRSSNGGATWLDSDIRLDTTLAGSAAADSPQIAVSGSSVYVTWQDRRDGALDIYFNRSVDGGATWLSTDVRLETDAAGAASSGDPQIAASGSSVYVVWGDNRNGSRDIYLNHSVDEGATWQRSDVRLDTDLAGAAVSTQPQIAACDSSVYVTWQDDRNRRYVGYVETDIYLNRSSDAGASWLASDVRLNTDPAGTAGSSGSQTPAIAASGSAVYVAWMDGRDFPNSDIYSNRSLDWGVSWLDTDVRLDTDPAGATYSAKPRSRRRSRQST